MRATKPRGTRKPNCRPAARAPASKALSRPSSVSNSCGSEIARASSRCQGLVSNGESSWPGGGLAAIICAFYQQPEPGGFLFSQTFRRCRNGFFLDQRIQGRLED